MKEIWKDIKGYEGLYQVSNLGRVKSLERYKENHNKLQKVEKKIKIPSLDNIGYLKTILYRENKQKNLRIHRAVAQAFIPNPNNYSQVNHKDGNKLNNNVNNLEWITSTGNIKHAWDNGLRKHLKRPIYQLDLKGNYIKTWNNICEASRELNICRSSISACCNNYRSKTAGGYKWRFAE